MIQDLREVREAEAPIKGAFHLKAWLRCKTSARATRCDRARLMTCCGGPYVSVCCRAQPCVRQSGSCTRMWSWFCKTAPNASPPFAAW